MTAVAAGGDRGGSRRPIGLTMGDPAGVGPDLAIEAWVGREAAGLSPFLLYADPDLIAARAADLGMKCPVAVVTDAGEAAGVFATRVPVMTVKLAAPSRAGKPDSANAGAVIAAIDRAVEDVATGRISAVVTNPIAKSVLYAAGFKHPGHTEYLGELAARFWPGAPSRPLMMLSVETEDVTLRVAPLTIHVPLRDVPALVTANRIIETARTLATALKRDFGLATARIAVAGLNPHAGEDGAIGTEDRDVIAPAIERLKAEGLSVTGPHSADTMFHATARRNYDAAIAMYHDQALIPIKSLAFDAGVNVTLGLPFIRTSPDHGTAFDIAGTGRASPSSLIAALKLARRMAARRAQVSA
ncbi:MAG: 4-hydroxythreonine-4-phosphate dehydrogenase PdxA [Hyphomicrobium sp.]